MLIHFEDLAKPFSNFSLGGKLVASYSATLNNIQMFGMLYGNDLKNTATVHDVFTATMKYDYIKNTLIQFGVQSFNLKLISDSIFRIQDD